MTFIELKVRMNLMAIGEKILKKEPRLNRILWIYILGKRYENKKVLY